MIVYYLSMTAAPIMLNSNTTISHLNLSDVIMPSQDNVLHYSLPVKRKNYSKKQKIRKMRIMKPKTFTALKKYIKIEF
ncbi:hypothetical protein [Rachiplusia nu nucleopolyhedrovirus]|uniref:Uncharacterized protein n=1 Tax=Rachiplusia nu nucleopolyhedrovirus TaxID=2605775 RepID=A0AAE6M6B7_9ABAC|nr:hypothetical protein QKQ55_gp040 [Rachiplusia nu nucleopolyhedrovirus]QEI03593.1 hypothetical protein [Rachiplusia nu nucleopolyhedrovirus]